MNTNLISAIIGFWRMGATIEEIIGLTLISKDEIEGIIFNYRLQMSYKHLVSNA